MKMNCNFYKLITNKNDPRFPSGALGVDLDECRVSNENRWDIFWTMNGFDFGKRSKADLKFINCFYADLDSGTFSEMQKRISGFPDPSSIVQTGKGYHLYWWLKKEIDCTSDPEKYANWFREFTLSRIVPPLCSDPQAADACRLLRAPFYKYWKDGLGDKHTDIVYESDVFYDLNFIEKYFPVTASADVVKIKTKTQEIPAGDFWSRANELPVIESLERLSGTAHVNGETFKIKRRGKSIRIECNDKKTNAWIDENETIGSTDGAGPAIPNWIYWYQRDWKKVAQILKEVFEIKEI